jgi:hypothetical protein
MLINVIHWMREGLRLIIGRVVSMMIRHPFEYQRRCLNGKGDYYVKLASFL